DPALASRGRAIVATTFNLSLDLLRDQLVRVGTDADCLLSGFHALAQAPASGFGASLGAAIADLSASELEELIVNAGKLSLLDPVLATERPDRAWRIHALLAELLQRSHGEEEGRRAFDRMTEWFVSRLPELPSGQEEEMGRRWREVQAEIETLTAWLARVRLEDRIIVLAAGSRYATRVGPFHAWVMFCEEMLADFLEDAKRSDALWVLGQVSLKSGLLDRAMKVAQDKLALDSSRGEEHRVAIAVGLVADILEAQGQLDDALKIRQEEEIPVYERIGDIRARAVTLGKVADILQARGQLDDTLKIRQDEELPIYEKIGDIRSRAVTLGQIADILQARGQLDDALKIRQNEELPVYEKIGDIREQAITLGKIAQILKERGQLDDALRITQDESLPVLERIGDMREILACRLRLVLIYLQRNGEGDRETAKQLLLLALEAAERLRIPEADQIRNILRRVEDPEGDPE
ncbi:MAG TPA: hypothetical protein VLQ45_12210, partial [Thermoanaerobaculia bacterium]|nr:hypothetical protein [Thermoanaerobaculia bacterium]